MLEQGIKYGNLLEKTIPKRINKELAIKRAIDTTRNVSGRYSRESFVKNYLPTIVQSSNCSIKDNNVYCSIENQLQFVDNLNTFRQGIVNVFTERRRE